MSGNADLGLPVLDIVFGTHIIADLTLEARQVVDGCPG
jgi:acetoacetate decarboxylase